MVGVALSRKEELLDSLGDDIQYFSEKLLSYVNASLPVLDTAYEHSSPGTGDSKLGEKEEVIETLQQDTPPSFDATSSHAPWATHEQSSPYFEKHT
jgi:hypothetical protein